MNTNIKNLLIDISSKLVVLAKEAKTKSDLLIAGFAGISFYESELVDGVFLGGWLAELQKRIGFVIKTDGSVIEGSNDLLSFKQDIVEALGSLRGAVLFMVNKSND